MMIISVANEMIHFPPTGKYVHFLFSNAVIHPKDTNYQSAPQTASVTVRLISTENHYYIKGKFVNDLTKIQELVP
jgi:hypothetical protein